MKKISLIVAISMICTMLVPTFAFAETLGTSTVVDNEYYYESFDGYTGASGWFDTASTNGYYSPAGNIFSNYSDAKNGTGLKIVNKTTSFKFFNGPRGNADTYFDVSTAQFENAGATLVFTADVLIKDSLSKDSSGLCINLHALKDDWQNLNSTLYSISALPMYTKHWQKGATFFVPIQAAGNTQAGWTGGNATDYVTTNKTDGSSWVKLISVVNYDKANQKYVTTSYVDGKPIYNAKSSEISKLEVPASTDDVATRTRFGISVNYRANNTDTSLDEYAVVDNLAMYLCDTAVPQSGTVSGKTITIPFNNGKTFTDENAPDVVTSGYLNLDTVSNAKLTDEDGNEIDGAVITATQSEIKVTAPASVGGGQKVKVDLTGVEDIAGNQVELDTSEYTVSGDDNKEEETPTPPNPPTPEVTGAPYYYEDFERYTGASNWFNTGSTNGYNSNSGDIFSVYSDDKNGTSLKIVNKTTSFKGFNGPRGNADAYFDVSTAQFEDAGATLVFTADVLIKDSLSKDSSGLYINLHALKGDWQNLNSTLYSISALPMYTKHWQKGATFFVPIQAAGNTQAGWTGGNATDYVTTNKTDGSSWVKLISVVNYDKANQKYVTTSYVDGKPIYNAKSSEISKLEVPASTDDVATRTRFGISVNYRANNTDTSLDEYAVVDNLAMYLCDTAVPQSGTVSGKTITIPFKNGKTFTDANAPATVTNSYLNVDTVNNAKLKTEDGAEIDGAVITATQSEIKVTVPASVGGGDKVKVDLTGVKDIAGKQVGLDSTLYTINGAINAANSKYFQDFEGIANLSEAGYNPVNISATDTNKTFVLTTTAEKGNGLAVNYTAASSSKSVTAPDANATYGFSVDAAAFETAGKEFEYGYDVFIPGGAYKGEALAGYLILKKANGTVIQYCSELPWLTNTDNTNPNLKFRAINDDSIKSDWTEANNNIYPAIQKPGVDQKNKSVYVDYAETEDGGWVSVKSRVSYVKDADGKGYYMTKYYVNGEVMRNSDGSPAIFKIQENLVPANSERRYLQFSLYGNNGENNSNKIVVDNIFANVVDAEDGELTVYDFVGANGEYSFVYNNLSASAKPYQFIIAGYGLGGDLISVDITKKGNFAGRSTGTVSSALVADSNITEYKVFLWEDFTACTPIMSPLTD